MKRFVIPAALAFAAATCLSGTANAEKYSELYYQRASLFDTLGVDSTDIVFLGNSLTHGCEWHELLGMPNIKNRGINGDVVAGIDQRVASIVNGRPAKLFLMSGANDVSHDLSSDSIATAIDALIGRIQAETPETRIYLQSMLPINNSFGRYKKMAGKEDIIREINVRLEKIAAKRGITWINLYPHFTDADGNLKVEFTNDGLHLLAPGYLVWRDIVLPYVKE